MHKFEKWMVNSKLTSLLHKKILFPSFFKFVNKELKGTALEIGCGVGKTTEEIARRYKKLIITAVDYDKEQIIVAQKRGLQNVTFKQGDATKLPFKMSSFDYVIETNTFHHIKNYQRAIREVHKVLKNRGTFYVMDISRYFFIWPLSLLFPPESYFTKEEFKADLERNGFKVEKLKGRFVFLIAAVKGSIV